MVHHTIEVLPSLAMCCHLLPCADNFLTCDDNILQYDDNLVSYPAIPSSGGGPPSGKAPAYNSKSKATAPSSTTARRGLPRDTGERDFGVLEGEMG